MRPCFPIAKCISTEKSIDKAVVDCIQGDILAECLGKTPEDIAEFMDLPLEKVKKVIMEH